MKHIFGILVLVLSLAAAMPAAKAQQVAGIAAVVNDEAISMEDVKARMILVMASSGLPNNEEIRNKILPQVVDSLIEEQLKLQAAAREKITIADEKIEEGFGIIAQQNKFTAEEFRGLMKKAGVPITTLTHQIKAQLAWNEYIKKVLRNRVDVNERDVDTRIERIKAKIGQTEYLVSEIYLPLDDSKRNAETQQFAQRMAQELQAKKAPFGAVAAQFSKAAGAEKGGSLGWIQPGQLDPELDKVLLGMEEGSISNPVKITDGLHILHLIKKRTLTEEAIPSRDDLTNTIGNERLDRVQQRAMMDLKSAAFIDRRV